VTHAVASTHEPAPKTTLLVGVLAALGCGLLAARPAVLASARQPVIALGLVFAGLLIAGALVPLPTVSSPIKRSSRVTAVTIVIGVGAFGAARLLAGGHAPARLTVPVVLANTLAAVAEEAWFRRVCFGLLAPAGSVIAVGGSALLFASVHVATYGFWILPLDLAAGALLGWQRAVSGSWGATAVTHAVANVFVLL
jgi:Type II CAAX prenyl endopeptidase Rce1-like